MTKINLEKSTEEKVTEIKEVKRPFYKKKSFWVIGLILIAILSTLGEEEPTGQAPEIETPQVVESDDAVEDEVEVEEPEEVAQVSREWQNALDRGRSYLRFSAFSFTGLANQLAFEEFPEDAIEWAMEQIDLEVDWSEQALASAESYLRFSAFSLEGLGRQLEFEGFKAEEVSAALGQLESEVDWYEQAVRSAESYLNFSSFSRSGLIDQLLFEGFTQSQAEHGTDVAFE